MAKDSPLKMPELANT